MKLPSWWPHDPADCTHNERTLEQERLVGRLGILTKRIEQLEIQFGGLYDSCCDLMGRVKSLENQTLWHEPVETNDRIAEAVRQERDANNAGPATTTIHMFGDEVELEEQLRDGKRKISRYAMKELKKRIKKK